MNGAHGNQHYRWNYRLWVVETSLWMFSTALLDSTTVLPVLIQSLSGSPFLASLIISLRYAGQGWPQLISASIVSGKALRKPYYFLAVIPGRLLLLWPAFVLLMLPGSPTLALGAILLAYFAFWISEGFSIVPWVDMLGKTVPATRRGRLFAAMHVLGGILGILAGVLVREVLNHRNLPFPTGYGVLFLMAFASLVVSTVSLGMLREPPSPPHEEQYSTRALIRDIPNLLRDMPQFRLLILLQALFGFAVLPAPFYILYVVELLQRYHAGMANTVSLATGVFLAVQTMGMIIGNTIWGHLGDIYGNRLVLRALAFTHALVPLAAALAGILAPLLPAWLLYMAFIPTFLGFGSLLSGTWMTVTNFLLEIAPEHDRPAYIAVSNALNLPAVILPMIGGLLLQRLGYSTIFLIATLFLFYAYLLSGALREPRETPHHPPHPPHPDLGQLADE